MNFQKGLISVIIPVYNREQYIEECLQSVFNQTFKNFEIVIVDDGSTDKSFEICKAFAEKDKRIKLFNADHGGVSAARNLALDKANGEYIFFLDSDDVIHPSLLVTLIDGMQTHNAGIAGTSVVPIPEQNWNLVEEKLANAKHIIGKYEAYEPIKALESSLYEKSPLGCIGGVMIAKELIGDTKFTTDVYIGEDYYFIYENLIKNPTVVFLKSQWYYARFHETNSSWDYAYSGFWTRFLRRKLVWESEEKLGRTANANKQKKGAFYCFTICIARNKPYSGDSKKMRKVLKEYKKAILPAMSFRGKIIYTLSCYLPLTTYVIFKIRTRKRKY